MTALNPDFQTLIIVNIDYYSCDKFEILGSSQSFCSNISILDWLLISTIFHFLVNFGINFAGLKMQFKKAMITLFGQHTTSYSAILQSQLPWLVGVILLQYTSTLHWSDFKLRDRAAALFG